MQITNNIVDSKNPSKVVSVDESPPNSPSLNDPPTAEPCNNDNVSKPTTSDPIQLKLPDLNKKFIKNVYYKKNEFHSNLPFNPFPPTKPPSRPTGSLIQSSQSLGSTNWITCTISRTHEKHGN